MSAGVGVAAAAFGRRKRRSLEEEKRLLDLDLDFARITLENSIETFLDKLSKMHLK